jgi:hypothetical protein
MRTFSGYIGDGYAWFRIFGIGLSFKDLRKHGMLFSERNHFEKYIILFRILIKYLSRTICQ